MTAPTYVAAGTIASANTTTLNVPYYAGLAANDIAVIYVGTFEVTPIADISGWTGFTQASNNPNYGRAYWKRLVGSESGNVTVTGSTAGDPYMWGIMFGVRGCITSATPIEGFASNTGSGTTAASPSTVVSGDDRLMMRFLSSDGDGGYTVPATWTDRIDAFASGIGFGEIYAYSKTRNSGTESATNITLDFFSFWVTMGMAFIPVPITYIQSDDILRQKRRRKVIGF